MVNLSKKRRHLKTVRKPKTRGHLKTIWKHKTRRGGYKETVNDEINSVIELTKDEYESIGDMKLNDIALKDYFENNNNAYILKPKYRNDDIYNQIKTIFQINYIAEGSYGATYTAFPNTGQTLRNVKDKVVKLYFTKEAYDAEINRQKSLKDIIKSQTIDIYSYKISPTITNISSRMNQYPNAKNRLKDTPLYMIQMPNLGMDIFEIYDKQVDLSTLPPKKLELEILKMLRVVDEINTKQYIHGDIRLENVLINLEKGDMTIIDFDLFSTMDDFYDKYMKIQALSTHMPLECILLRYLKSGYDIPTNINVRIIKQILQDTLNYKRPPDEFNAWLSGRTDTSKNILKYANDFLNTIRSNNGYDIQKGYDMIKNNMDLYGLGTCIKMIMSIPNSIRDDVKEYINGILLPNIMDGLPDHNGPFTRWTIKETIDNYSRFLTTKEILPPPPTSVKRPPPPPPRMNMKNPPVIRKKPPPPPRPRSSFTS